VIRCCVDSPAIKFCCVWSEIELVCGVSFAKFLFLSSWFAKLLEINFSYFTKTSKNVRALQQVLSLPKSSFSGRHYTTQKYWTVVTFGKCIFLNGNKLNKKSSESENSVNQKLEIPPSFTQSYFISI
jgi:hypothetical protein